MPRLKLNQGGGESPLRKILKSTPIISTAEENPYIYFVDSGSWMLNLSLTNHIDKAYPVGRVVNLIGGYGSGKTLSAEELVNSIWYIEHLQKGKKVKIYYDEPEWRFNIQRGIKFGLPIENIYGLRERLKTFKAAKEEIPFKTSKTVENVYANINRISKEETEHDIILYILDSLDSVSDAREVKHIKDKGIEKQDHGGGKARVLSQMFRTCIESVNRSNILFFIISQIRANYGVIYGPKFTRAGGNALDHYADLIIWLSELNRIQTKNKINQGTRVQIDISKNIGSKQDQFQFNILEDYGIDNYGSAIEFLWNKGGIEKSGSWICWPDGKKYYASTLIELCAHDPVHALILKQLTQKRWDELMNEAKINRLPKWRV